MIILSLYVVAETFQNLILETKKNVIKILFTPSVIQIILQLK